MTTFEVAAFVAVLLYLIWLFIDLYRMTSGYPAHWYWEMDEEVQKKWKDLENERSKND